MEHIRGCGWRKLHACYLVGEYLAEPCDRLPMPLSPVCPVCHSGIKFSRGVTLINPHKLFGEHKKCKDEHKPCMICQAEDNSENHYLMFVGSEYTTDGFIAESRKEFDGKLFGISKRIHQIPKGLKLGESVIYLAHKKAIVITESTDEQISLDEVQHRMIDAKEKIRYGMGVFCAFRPQRIEQLFHESEKNPELEAQLAKRNITPVYVDDNDPHCKEAKRVKEE